MVWVDRWQAMREGPLSDAAMTRGSNGYRTEISNAAIRNYARWSGVLDPPTWSGKGGRDEEPRADPRAVDR